MKTQSKICQIEDISVLFFIKFIKIHPKCAQRHFVLASVFDRYFIIRLLLLLLSCFSVSDSVRPHRRQPTRLPHPWDSPGKNTGEGCHLATVTNTLVSDSFNVSPNLDSTELQVFLFLVHFGTEYKHNQLKFSKIHPKSRYPQAPCSFSCDLGFYLDSVSLTD